MNASSRPSLTPPSKASRVRQVLLAPLDLLVRLVLQVPKDLPEILGLQERQDRRATKVIQVTLVLPEQPVPQVPLALRVQKGTQVTLVQQEPMEKTELPEPLALRVRKGTRAILVTPDPPALQEPQDQPAQLEKQVPPVLRAQPALRDRLVRQEKTVFRPTKSPSTTVSSEPKKTGSTLS